MASRFYSVAIVLIVGVFGLVTPPDLPFVTAQAQTAQDRKAEADKLIDLGNQQIDKSLYQEALSSFQSALEIYRAINNRNGEGSALLSQGLAYKKLGKYQKAIDFYQQSLGIFKQLGDVTSESDVLNNLGNAYTSFGKYQRAIDFFQQSLVIKKQIGDQNGEMTTLQNLAYVYVEKLGLFQKAFDLYQQSLSIVKRNGNQDISKTTLTNLAYSLNRLGYAYDKKLSQYPKAINILQQALEIARRIGDLKLEGDLLSNLGGLYDHLGQYQNAIDVSIKALDAYKQTSDNDGQANSFLGLGLAYKSLGQFQKAIEFYQQSLEISKQIGDRRYEKEAIFGLGNTYRRLGQYQKSIDLYQQSLEISKQISDQRGEGISLNNLGNVYQNIGQYYKAIDFHQQSLVILRQIHEPMEEGRTLGNLGNAFLHLGEYQTAIDFYQQSLKIAKQIGDRQSEAIWLANIGNAYNSLGNYRKMIEYWQKSLAIRKQIGDRDGESSSLRNYGLFFANLNQVELAILFYKQAINVTESIRKDIRNLDKDIKKSYLVTKSDIYHSLADLLLQQGRIIEALQVLDLLKVQELDDYLKNIKGNDRTSQGIRLLEPEKAFSDKLSTISYEQIPELNQQLTNQIQQLPKSEIDKPPEYLQNLPQGTALLDPLILDDRLEIVIFSANTPAIHHTVNIKRKDLEYLALAFRVNLKDYKTNKIKDTSKKIYDVLIKPVEDDLKQAKIDTILYAPDGLFRYIPIAALYDGNQWLVEKYRINNLIAYVLFEPNTKPSNNPNIFTGAFGNSDKGIPFGFKPLPYTIAEANNIQNSFPAASKLVEQDFTPQASQTQATGKSIVHLATHARFNSRSPLESYILFGDGKQVNLLELSEWNLQNVDLFILSACETGRGGLGKDNNGIEILGLGYQVQKAGAKASIASLWEVNDGGTQLLIQSFYEAFKQQNLRLASALREAQIRMIHPKAGEINFSHPYYWAGFILIGNGL